mmetsp:Transcript_1454/g.5156  ORF Transcript_1454/g.5156 Transcript_1454/m.5156 type:complete len:503 (-) Transcript_1454:79-1587(-)
MSVAGDTMSGGQGQTDGAANGEAVPWFVLEHQPNIYCFQLFVAMPRAPAVPRVALEVLQGEAGAPSTGAMLRLQWNDPEMGSATAKEREAENGSEKTAATPPVLEFRLECPGLTADCFAAALEGGGEYLHVRVQPPPLPISAHRLVTLEQRSRVRGRLPLAGQLTAIHCRACARALHRTPENSANAAERDVNDATQQMDDVTISEESASAVGGSQDDSDNGGRDDDAADEDEEAGIAAVHELPSENWLEMSDLWVCGCCGEGGTRGRFKHFPLEEIKARRGAALVSFSANYLMLHRSYFPAALPLVAGAEPAPWKPVECPGCGAVLGLTDACEGEESEASYKLFFHCISSGSRAGSDNWFERFSVESKLAQMVYELAKSRHCFRICIYETGQGNPCILIRVMNWATSLRSNVLPEAMQKDFTPVIKVLYSLPSDTKFEATSVSWRIMGKGKERLDLLPDEVTALLAVLAHNQQAWPRSLRTAFPGQTLSFLCLDSRPELPKL